MSQISAMLIGIIFDTVETTKQSFSDVLSKGERESVKGFSLIRVVSNVRYQNPGTF